MLLETTEDDLKIDFNINTRLHRIKLLGAIKNLKDRSPARYIDTLIEQIPQTEEIKGQGIKLSVPLIRLKCIDGQFEENEWIITETCNILGKSSSPGTITLVDDYLSNKHCQLSTSEGKIYIKDLGSSNGTFILIKGPTELYVDSLFKMGDNEFKVMSIGKTATLKCISEVGEEKLFEVEKESEFTIGRNKTNNLSIPEDASLSGLHGKLFFKDDKFYVKDENSTNKYCVLYT